MLCQPAMHQRAAAACTPVRHFSTTERNVGITTTVIAAPSRPTTLNCRFTSLLLLSNNAPNASAILSSATSLTCTFVSMFQLTCHLRLGLCSWVCPCVCFAIAAIRCRRRLAGAAHSWRLQRTGPWPQPSSWPVCPRRISTLSCGGWRSASLQQRKP